MKNKNFFVTSPLLPDFDKFNSYLKDIWDTKWLTNNGPYHQTLEKKLGEYLDVKHISLFSNGTLSLMIALKALDITGEVITTPYSFVATSNSIIWQNLRPVFVDIDPDTCNLDCSKIERAVTNETSAIMPVHIYGNPCDVKQIEKISSNYNLRTIYDASHAFGVKLDNNSILNYGDLSVLSFHATKVFSTIEGGAIICHNKKIKKRIDGLKNFGIEDEVNVSEVGINAKLNEIQSAFGLANLEKIDGAIEKRKIISDEYKKQLKNVLGISYQKIPENVAYNYSYFPIFINDKSALSRDELYESLKTKGIHARRYFYPLITNLKPYRGKHPDFKVAKEVSESVLCLPLYPDLSMEEVKFISQNIKDLM